MHVSATVPVSFLCDFPVTCNQSIRGLGCIAKVYFHPLRWLCLSWWQQHVWIYDLQKWIKTKQQGFIVCVEGEKLKKVSIPNLSGNRVKEGRSGLKKGSHCCTGIRVLLGSLTGIMLHKDGIVRTNYTLLDQKWQDALLSSSHSGLLRIPTLAQMSLTHLQIDVFVWTIHLYFCSFITLKVMDPRVEATLRMRPFSFWVELVWLLITCCGLACHASLGDQTKQQLVQISQSKQVIVRIF